MLGRDSQWPLAVFSSRLRNIYSLDRASALRARIFLQKTQNRILFIFGGSPHNIITARRPFVWTDSTDWFCASFPAFSKLFLQFANTIFPIRFLTCTNFYLNLQNKLFNLFPINVYPFFRKLFFIFIIRFTFELVYRIGFQVIHIT